jgi:hypothetical protein
MSFGLQEGEFQDFWKIVMWWWYGCQPYTPAAFIPQEIPLLLISISSWVDSKAIVLPTGLSKWKTPITNKFLVNEGVKPAVIYRRLQGQYGDKTLSRSKTFEWCKRFKYGRTSVSDFITTCFLMHALTLLSAILINGLWTGPRHVRRLSVIGHSCHLLLCVVPPR